ncbi:MAG: HAD-IA family hydrolase [Desulfosarcina sp.]|nr:HAD-IA family hydrolase [Desulfobacterales bacterium]
MTLYIFDMGEVVACNTDVFPPVFNHLKITAEQFYVLAGPNLERLMNGEISVDDFWMRFSLRYGKKVKEELFVKYFNPGLDQNVVAILKQLKNTARVVCGTNTFDPHYDYLSPRGYYNLFDAVYASNKIGVSKPHPDFYQRILITEGVKPEDSVFIDDAEVNVRSAAKLGIWSILFKNATSLRSEIDRHQGEKGLE